MCHLDTCLQCESQLQRTFKVQGHNAPVWILVPEDPGVKPTRGQRLYGHKIDLHINCWWLPKVESSVWYFVTLFYEFEAWYIFTWLYLFSIYTWSLLRKAGNRWRHCYFSDLHFPDASQMQEVDCSARVPSREGFAFSEWKQSILWLDKVERLVMSRFPPRWWKAADLQCLRCMSPAI